MPSTVSIYAVDKYNVSKGWALYIGSTIPTTNSMAIVTGNLVLSGFSGTLGGNLVFRQYGNKSVVSVKREPRKTRRNRPSILQQMGQ